MPTDLKQIHHDEQMEALRREFTTVWPGIWKRISDSDRKATHALCHHVAWLAFVAGKGIKDPA